MAAAMTARRAAKEYGAHGELEGYHDRSCLRVKT